MNHNIYKEFSHFLILGAQKSGTTALSHYLSKDSNFIPSQHKESNYFLFKNELNLETYTRIVYSVNYKRDQNLTKYYDSSVGYLYYKQCIPLIKTVLPQDTKFVIILRDPIERAFSAWNMFKLFWDTPNWKYWLWHRRKNLINTYNKKIIVSDDNNKNGIKFLRQKEIPSFETCIKNEIQSFHNYGMQYIEPGILSRGIYITQINNWLEHFPMENLLIIKSATLNASPLDICKNVCYFLETEFVPTSLNRINGFKGAYSNIMSPETKQILQEFYQPYNNQLTNQFGIKL